MLRHLAAHLPVGGQGLAHLFLAPIVNLNQSVNGLLKQFGPLVGQLTLVVVHDQQQPYHQWGVDQHQGIVAQPGTPILLQLGDAVQQVRRSSAALAFVAGEDAAIRLLHHRGDVQLIVDGLDHDFLEAGSQRGALTLVGNRAAGDDGAQLLLARHQALDRFAHQGALVLVGHFIQPIQQQNDVLTSAQQAAEEIAW